MSHTLIVSLFVFSLACGLAPIASGQSVTGPVPPESSPQIGPAMPEPPTVSVPPPPYSITKDLTERLIGRCAEENADVADCVDCCDEQFPWDSDDLFDRCAARCYKAAW